MNEFGCLMVDFDIAGWSNLQQYIGIETNDLTEPLPQDPHCTISYGFSADFDPTYLPKICPHVNLLDFCITDVGCFKNPNQDVLYFALESTAATALNNVLVNSFEIKNDYPNYIPHMTIGFFKPACAEKYRHKVKYLKNTKLNPTRYRYSYPSGNEFYF